MKILNINPYYNSINNNTTTECKQSQLIYKNKLEKDTFTFSGHIQNKKNIKETEISEAEKEQIDQNIKAAHEFSCKKGKVTKEEFYEFKKNFPNLIPAIEKLLSNNLDIKSSPKTIAGAAFLLKNYFDSKYKENYKIIAIGTSPAIIAEAMENLGSEVIYLPISGVRNYSYEDLCSKDCEKEMENVAIAMEYLDNKGINKKSKEKIILLDFYSSGTTLSYVRHFVIDFLKLSSLKLRNVSLLNRLNKELIKADSFHRNKEFPKGANPLNFTMNDLFNLSNDIATCTIEQVSNTPHFYLNDISNIEGINCISSKDKTSEEIFKLFDEYSNRDARLFSLCVLNELDKLNLL